ncbi:universal stress protein [Chitinophaga filiformis]|uniref:Universal stress protein n=1 Tax=Chitinophaga filiformis TaxID=104663 RepID=A0ABY4HZ53_CHIFI|nr:universal stress protein [Chitinophaga filiformis]UPK68213.1 universal stress protein [Chitinophaga filiformis]
MQTILVLTDFSNVALRAAQYAIHLAGQLHSRRILLFNAYQSLEPVSNVPVTPELPIIQANPDELYKESIMQLDKLRDLLEPTAAGITIDTLSEDDILEEAVRKLISKEQVDLVVAGLADKSNLEKFLVGSHSIRVMESCNYPLVIVPEDARITPLEKVLLAVDFETLRRGKALAGLVEILNSIHAELYVVNVASDEGYSSETKEDIQHLHQLLDKYHPSFNYVEDTNVVNSINEFAAEHDISMIIAVHEKKGLLATIFQKSVSKQLAWNSNVPLLILPA